jgi:transcriptional regulator with XRE-family HTH domain
MPTVKFDATKLSQFQTLDDFEREVLSIDEVNKVQAQAEARSIRRRALAEDVSKEIAAYMAREGIGYNELTRRLNVSPATTSKLLKGSGNITLETIAQIAELIGKTPHILFR